MTYESGTTEEEQSCPFCKEGKIRVNVKPRMKVTKYSRAASNRKMITYFTNEKTTVLSACPKCGKTLVPARTFCPECFVDMGEWKEVSQEGAVVTWTLANYEFFGMPVDFPFIGALVRLDGTDCDFLHLVGGLDLNDPTGVRNKIKKGTRVRALWSDERKGHMLDIKYFEPVSI